MMMMVVHVKLKVTTMCKVVMVDLITNSVHEHKEVDNVQLNGVVFVIGNSVMMIVFVGYRLVDRSASNDDKGKQ